MMSKQIYRIESYTFNQTDVVLFDANVWMYLYSPQGEQYPKLKAKYESGLRRIRGAKGRIFIDVLVLSEFINAYARFVYNDLPSATKPANFKRFRKSADFKLVAEDIAKYSRRILEKTERTESGFESVDVRSLINEFAAGEVDFNDQMLAELCGANNLKLVTHDVDFEGENLTILTANPKLIA